MRHSKYINNSVTIMSRYLIRQNPEEDKEPSVVTKQYQTERQIHERLTQKMRRGHKLKPVTRRYAVLQAHNFSCKLLRYTMI